MGTPSVGGFASVVRIKKIRLKQHSAMLTVDMSSYFGLRLLDERPLVGVPFPEVCTLFYSTRCFAVRINNPNAAIQALLFSNRGQMVRGSFSLVSAKTLFLKAGLTQISHCLCDFTTVLIQIFVF